MAVRIPAEIRSQFVMALRQSAEWASVNAPQQNGSGARQLAQYLYATWYVGHQRPPAKTNDLAPSISAACRAAHFDSRRWDAGGVVTAVFPDGSIATRRGTESRFLHRGDYASANPSDCLPAIGQSVLCVSRIDQVSNGYWSTWSPAWASFTGRLVRLYWNITPAAAPTLVRELTRSLEQQSPYALKVPLHETLFNRPDAVVLYVPAEMFARAPRAFRRIQALVDKAMRADTPKLTCRLGRGLAAAENPQYAHESFGQKRCRLIASAAYRLPPGATEDEALSAVSDTFAAAGIPIDRPWLEPWNVHK